MIPFNNESGLRDYRAALHTELAPARWPGLVLAAFLLGLVLGFVR